VPTPTEASLEVVDLSVATTDESGSRIQLIQNFSYAFKPGTVTLIPGPQNSGKTKLVYAFMGEKKAEGGEVLINGQPLASFDRKQIFGFSQGVIFHPDLQGATIEDWLRSGKPDATSEEMWEALRLVFLEEPVRLLQYDTRRQSPFGKVEVEKRSGLEYPLSMLKSFKAEARLIELGRLYLQGAPILVLTEFLSVPWDNRPFILTALENLRKLRRNIILTSSHPVNIPHDWDVAFPVKGRVETGKFGLLVKQGLEFSRWYIAEVEAMNPAREPQLPALPKTQTAVLTTLPRLPQI
jgi:energy-coupling factor transporter ATP-binding protein EcfA2